MRARWKLFILLALLSRLSFASDYAAEAKILGELMHWQPGQSIAEIGAGEGEMSVAAASAVGRSGHVYASELNKGKLTDLQKLFAKRRLANASAVQASDVDTNLPANCCDAVFMRHVYHHFADPSKTLASIAQSLKPGGLVAVIDFAPRYGHGVAQATVAKALTNSGFELLDLPHAWPNSGDYCVIARKAAGS